MSNPINRQVIRPSSVVLQDLEGEAVLLNLVNGQYYGLDENSFHFYHVLVSAPSVQTAYTILFSEYDIESERLKADLDRFLEHLIENGLVVYANDPSG
jgi:hypothetical protein